MSPAGATRAQAPPEPSPEGDWLQGRTVVHTIVLALAAPKMALVLLLADLAATAGDLRSLTVKPVRGRGFEVVLQVGGLDAGAAQHLVERFAGRPSVEAAAVEHMLVC